MISSANAFGGMSAADFMKLFGANSSSSSSSPTSTSPVVAESASVGVSISSVSDSAKTIQTILAEAEIEKAPTATSAGLSASTRVAAAYVSQTGASSTSASASGEDTLDAAYTLYDQAWNEAAQMANAGDSDPTNWSTQASSLVVATANGVSAVATGSSSSQTIFDEAVALGFYAGNLQDVQEGQSAASQVPSAQTSASSASASNATSGASQGSNYLQLNIDIDISSSTKDEGDEIAAKAQQLITAFDNHTLTPTSSDATGFSYSGQTNSGVSFSISGIEVSSSYINSTYAKSYQADGYETNGYNTNITSDANGMSELKSLVEQTAEHPGGSDGTEQETKGLGLTIPIGS